MSGSDRGAIFALGLVVGIAVAFAIAFWSFPWFTYPNYEAVKSITEDGQAPQNGQQLLDAYLPTFVSSNDTLAQWLMTLFSFLATVVSVWAVTLLRETLLETRNAVKSADDAVSVTREIGEAQTRAYIEFEAREFIPVFGNPNIDMPTGFRFRLIIKNSGQTPAHLIRAQTVYFPGPNNIEQTVSAKIKMGNDTEINQRIGSGTTYFLSAPTINADEIRKFQRRGHLYILAYIEYATIYSAQEYPKVTQFCFRIDFVGDPFSLRRDTAIESRNAAIDFTAYARFNITIQQN